MSVYSKSMLAMDSYQSDSSTQGNCTLVFRTQAYTNVAIIKAALSASSTLVSLVVLCYVVLLKKWKFFSERLVFLIILSTLLASVSSLLNRIDFDNQGTPFYHGFCVFGGFLTQVTSLMFVFSTLFITLHIFSLVVLDKSLEKYEWVCVFGVVAVPLLVSWIPFINSAYAKAGVWCWIRSFDSNTCEVFRFGQYLQFIMLYVPMFAVFFLEFALYTAIFVSLVIKRRKVRRMLDQELKEKLKRVCKEMSSLLPYPLIFIVFNVPLLANRIYASVNPGQQSLALWYASGLSIPMQFLFAMGAFTVGTRVFQDFKCITLLSALKKRKKVMEYPMEDGSHICQSILVPGPSSPAAEYTTYSPCKISDFY